MRLISLTLLCGLMAGCTVSWRVSATAYVRPRTYVQVDSPCPAPLETATSVSDKPEPAAVYVAGHWTWQSGWVWVSGEWKVPRVGYTWEPPVCEGDDHFYPGYFRPEDEAPPPIYRAPDTTPMYCPPPAGVEVRPSGSATSTTTVRPAPDTTVQPSGGTTTTTNVAPDTTVRPSGGTTTTTNVAPDTTVRPSGGTTTTTTIAPDTTVQPSGGTTTTTNVAPTQLSCRLAVARVPRGGRIAITGTGFTAETTVSVGGSTAAVARWSATELSVEASSSGAVTITRGGQTQTCGRVTLF